MKIVKVLLVGMFVLGICKPVSALNLGFTTLNLDLKSLKYIGSLDLFTVGSSEDRFEHTLRTMKSNRDLTTYGINSKAAIGGRIGALYPVEGVADVGLTWGYIAGPNGSWKLDGYKYQKFSRRFYRMLIEAQRTMEINNKFSFLGGAGLGWAWGKQTFVTELQYARWENCVLVDTYDDNFSGLTWELSAGLTYKAMDKLAVDFGVRYAGFPHAPNKHDVNGGFELSGMDWNSFGIFTGVRF